MLSKSKSLSTESITMCTVFFIFLLSVQYCQNYIFPQSDDENLVTSSLTHLTWVF